VLWSGADSSRWDTAGAQINDLSDGVEAVSVFYAQRRDADWIAEGFAATTAKPE
jgi:hypothetical protein